MARKTKKPEKFAPIEPTTKDLVPVKSTTQLTPVRTEPQYEKEPARKPVVSHKLSPDAEVYNGDILDTQAGRSYNQVTFTDQGTSANYLGNGRPANQPFTVRHTFNEGISEYAGPGEDTLNPIARSDRHALSILFDGEYWDIARLSSLERSVTLCKSSVGGWLEMGGLLELPNGYKLRLESTTIPVGNEPSAELLLLNPSDEVVQTLNPVPGEIIPLQTGDDTYWIHALNIDNTVELEAYNSLVEIRGEEPQGVVGGWIGATEEINLPNGYKIVINELQPGDFGEEVEFSIFDPSDQLVDMTIRGIGDVFPVELGEQKYWLDFRSINPDMELNMQVYNTDPAIGEQLEDGTRTRIEFGRGRRLEALELWRLGGE